MICDRNRAGISLLILFIIGGCVASPSTETISHPAVEVISLKDNFGMLEETAHQWDAKAYLSDVEIPLFLDAKDNSLWLISASFQSPDKHTQSIIVILNLDKTISVKRVSHTTGVNQVDPIYINNQLIDSSVVLGYFRNVDVASSLSSGDMVSLYLEHVQPKHGEPIAWRLSTLNVNVVSGDHYFIDALTGDELDIVR